MLLPSRRTCNLSNSWEGFLFGSAACALFRSWWDVRADIRHRETHRTTVLRRWRWCNRGAGSSDGHAKDLPVKTASSAKVWTVDDVNFRMKPKYDDVNCSFQIGDWISHSKSSSICRSWSLQLRHRTRHLSAIYLISKSYMWAISEFTGKSFCVAATDKVYKYKIPVITPLVPHY